MSTLPTICRVVYDTDPPTRDPDDDPVTPYRFSFLKSYSSSNSFGRNGERHSRFHENFRQLTDSQVSASAQGRWRSGKTESGRISRRNDGERNEGYRQDIDLSRWITEEGYLDVDPGPLTRRGIAAEETDEKLLESEEGWKHPTGSRKPMRLLWDPINNSWISQDPNSLVYLHFANGLSLADRGIHSNRTVLERRARFYPCMEKHLKSLDAVRRMAGANASMIWATQHLKRRGPSSQHRRVFPTTKDSTFDVPEYRSVTGGSSKSSSTSAIPGLVAAKKDETDQKRKEDEDSAIGRSVTTGSDEGQKKGEEDEEEEFDEDQKPSSVDNRVTEEEEEDVEDFISLDGHSGASDNRSELGGSDDGSGSGSTRTRLQRRVRIDERRRDSTDDEPEVIPDRRAIEQKIRQMKEKEVRGDGKVPDSNERLRILRGRTNRQRKEEDSDEDKEADKETRTRRQMEEETDDSSTTPPESLSNGRHGHRISLVQSPLPGIEAEPRPESAEATGRRHPMRRRPSWLQRMQRKQARRGGILRQRMDSKDDTEDNGIDLRFEDYDWLAKYCILDPNTVTICKKIFDEVDEDDVGRLTCHQTMVALRASNYKLTDMLEEYMYKIMELTGYEIENGTDYRLFSVLAALSQRITAVGDWMKCLINKMDMKTLETKLFVCKTLWECSVDAETKTLSLDDLCVELRAGGVSYEHEEHVREKLQHLRRLDLLDFLTYVPLFIMIHESVIENPLDDRRYK